MRLHEVIGTHLFSHRWPPTLGGGSSSTSYPVDDVHQARIKRAWGIGDDSRTRQRRMWPADIDHAVTRPFTNLSISALSPVAGPEPLDGGGLSAD